MKQLALRLAVAWLVSLLWASASVHAEPPPGRAELQAEPAQAAVLIDLNTATAQQLEELPGVGPSRAQAILEFRQAHGGFSQVSQLMRIKGIGRAMLRKLRPLVTISGKAEDGAAPVLHTSR